MAKRAGQIIRPCQQTASRQRTYVSAQWRLPGIQEKRHPLRVSQSSAIMYDLSKTKRLTYGLWSIHANSFTQHLGVHFLGDPLVDIVYVGHLYPPTCQPIFRGFQLVKFCLYLVDPPNWWLSFRFFPFKHTKQVPLQSKVSRPFKGFGP